MPAVCSFANNSRCFIPCILRAIVTLSPTIFRLPNANFRVFVSLTILFAESISENGLEIIGNTNYNKFNDANFGGSSNEWQLERPGIGEFYAQYSVA